MQGSCSTCGDGQRTPSAWEPFSPVSRHEDIDGDGVYREYTEFADKLMLPRIIIGETNSDDLYVYRDKDGDGVADEKTLWFARSSVPSGLRALVLSTPLSRSSAQFWPILMKRPDSDRS